MKLGFNRLAIDTFGQLNHVRVFTRMLDAGIPETHERWLKELKELAEKESWDYDDYQVEDQVLDAQLATWMPRLAGYSCVTFLHSIVETQLMALAERIGGDSAFRIRVSDMQGRDGTIKQSTNYLVKVAGIALDESPHRSFVLDELNRLRNMIVHSGGRPRQKDESLLLKLLRYAPRFEVRNDLAAGDYVWLSLSLCNEFAANIEDFFRYLFRAAGISANEYVL